MCGLARAHTKAGKFRWCDDKQNLEFSDFLIFKHEYIICTPLKLFMQRRSAVAMRVLPATEVGIEGVIMGPAPESVNKPYSGPRVADLDQEYIRFKRGRPNYSLRLMQYWFRQNHKRLSDQRDPYLRYTRRANGISSAIPVNDPPCNFITYLKPSYTEKADVKMERKEAADWLDLIIMVRLRGYLPTLHN